MQTDARRRSQPLQERDQRFVCPRLGDPASTDGRRSGRWPETALWETPGLLRSCRPTPDPYPLQTAQNVVSFRQACMTPVGRGW